MARTMAIDFGLVYLPAALLVSMVSVFTVRLGANLTHQLPVNVLKKVFVCLLILISVRMLSTSF